MWKDGSGRQTLTEGMSSLHGMNGPIDWSPDSTRLLFKSDTDPFEARIYVVDVNTHKIDSVTDGPWFYEAPSWSSDGKSAIFMSTRGGGWTWGFFRRAISGGEYETLTGPDYDQKNFPRAGRSGALIWSIHDEQDKEFLAERSRDGNVKILTEAGEGARWPEYSRDESQVLFTVMEHQVEYWIAENVLNGPSVETATLTPTDQAGPLVQEMQACVRDPLIDKTGRSPVDLHRR